MNDTQDLQQLLAQRDRLTHRLRAHDRMISALRLISLVALPVFLVWAVFAWRAGAIDIGMTAWMVPLALLFAFILTREFRFQDKVVGVFEVIMLLTGQYVWARDDPEMLRRDLVDCETKIAELQRQNDPGRRG
ncbi:MAG TPA: hypothetical protein VF913_19530 [Xanthobacteraceae bacterium]